VGSALVATPLYRGNRMRIPKSTKYFKWSLILNIILIILIGAISYKLRFKILDKISSFKNYNIVMFGNSLTAQGKWNAGLNRTDVLNSGTGGFTTSHFVMILNGAVIKHNPKICFIEGGINDIGVGIPLNRTFINYQSLIDTLIAHKIEPIIQSVLYTNTIDDSLTNSLVDSLNIFLRNITYEKRLVFLDLNNKLSKNKKLMKVFTTDGVHINESAYQIWYSAVKEILNRKNI
jgi:alpha-glucosidase